MALQRREERRGRKEEKSWGRKKIIEEFTEGYLGVLGESFGTSSFLPVAPKLITRWGDLNDIRYVSGVKWIPTLANCTHTWKETLHGVQTFSLHASSLPLLCFFFLCSFGETLMSIACRLVKSAQVKFYLYSTFQNQGYKVLYRGMEAAQ